MQGKLRKELGLVSAMAIVVGMVIGSGIFMKPGKVLAASGDSTMGLLAWILGGIITLAAGLTVAELGVQIPKTGGLYAYLDEVYGRVWGYLFGWVQTIIYGPATTAALGLYFSSLIIPFLSFDTQYKLPIAIAIVMFMSFVNCLPAKYGGMIQSVATAAKLIPIILIAVFGLLKGNNQILGVSSFAVGDSGTVNLGMAILATLWAYDGWVGVSYVAGEMKNPAKQLPQAIIIGLGLVMLAYIAVNTAMLHILSADKIVQLGSGAAGSAATWLFGGFGGRLVNIGIIISVFGALNGYILTSARVPYAMAIRGQLPAHTTISKLHPTWGTPINALILQVLLAIIMMGLGDPDRLTDIAMFILWVFYILAFVAVFIMRKRHPKAKRSYSVPFYPAVPVIAIAGALFIVINALFSSPMDSIYSLGITAIGLPVYWFLNNAQKSRVPE